MTTIPKLGTRVLYRQPDHEEPHGGSREHPARVTGYGTGRFDTSLDLDVEFAALSVEEGARTIAKRDVTFGWDAGEGSWTELPAPVEVAPAPVEDATG